ncbi:unnamed protein product [Closterium sp. NIES-54]
MAKRAAASRVSHCERVALSAVAGGAGAAPDRPGSAEKRGRQPGGAAPGGAESWGAEPGDAEPERAESGGPSGVSSRREPLSPQRLHEWYARRCSRAVGATGPATGGTSAGATGGAAGAGAARAAGPGGADAVGGPASVGAAGPGGARTGGTGAAGAGGAAGVGAVEAGAAGGTGAGGAAGVVAGDPGAEGTGVHREPESFPASPESQTASPESRPESHVFAVCTGRRVLRQRPPPIPGTHYMPLRPSTAPQRVPLPPTVTHFLATAVTDPSFESTAAFALVAELVDFGAACRLDYAASLVAESESASICPPSVGGECALGTDVLEDRQEEFECFTAALPHLVSILLAPEGDPKAPDIPTARSYVEAIEGPYSSQWQKAMATKMASWMFTGTYVNEVPPPGSNIVSGMWIFRVKRLPGSPPVFKAHYVARGFSQRLGVDFFQTFSPTPKMTTHRVLLHVATQRDYELHSLDFNTAFLQGSLHEEIWLPRPPSFTGLFPAGTLRSLQRPVYGLRQAPREWHDIQRTTLAALGFAPSTADPSLFLRTDTTLPLFYVLLYVDDLVFATAC